MSKKTSKNKENDKSNTEKIDIIYDKELNACSAYDCTGLIPSAITDESEIDSYEEIYPYLSPRINQDSDHSK